MKLFSTPVPGRTNSLTCFLVYDGAGTYVGMVTQEREGACWNAHYCQFPGFGLADTDFADKPSAVEWLRGKHAKNR